MIEVRRLTKRFGRVVAVDDLSFEVYPGRVTGFLGPNGSGKSTTMRCMLGLDIADAGTTTFDGRPYRSISEPLREVGSLLDAGYVHPGRSARNHLRWLAASNGLPARRVDEALAMVGLDTVARKRVKAYSLGMKQRLGLAAVMLGDPATVILDEPANGLDPEGMRWIRDLLGYLAGQGRAVFVSSHLLSEMALMAHDLVVIGRGRLIERCTVDDFVERHSRRWVRVRGPQLAPLLDGLARGGATISAVDGAADGSGFDVEGPTCADVGELAARLGVVLHELSPQVGSLEEAFLQATAAAGEYHSQLPPPAPGSVP